MVVPEAFYRHPEVKEVHDRFWGSRARSPKDSVWIHEQREYFKGHIKQFIEEFGIDLLIPENVLAIPIHIPLGLAITEVIAETCIPTIAHHHDFAWERKRFLVNSISDYISMAFPPNLPSVSHIVISSIARHQLARRNGVGSTVIPNVMNFEEPPADIDEYAADLRDTLGLEDDELFILQPTRVIQRKGIEHAIELVNRLGMKARLVISHASGDEGDEYEQRVREYADLLGIRAMFASEIFDDERGETPDGRKIYSLWDAYPHADLVTYPSVFEGFGNAFLEGLYFKKPIVVNNYSIYSVDIRPKGFKVIEFDDFVTDETIRQTRHILANPKLADEMCLKNYELAIHHFSYGMLRQKLSVQLANCFGTDGFMMVS